MHVLTVLAYKAGEPVTSECLAGSVNTNPVVIRRLLLALQNAGLVETRKGAGLGSRLKKAPRLINLGEVYRAVEAEELFVFPTRKPNQECPVGQCIQRALGQIFLSTEIAMERELARTKLSDVLAAIHATCGKSLPD